MLCAKALSFALKTRISTFSPKYCTEQKPAPLKASLDDRSLYFACLKADQANFARYQSK